MGERLNDVVKWYYKPKSFEKSGKIYETFGIKSFKKIIPNGGTLINRLFGTKWVKGYGEKALKDYEKQTRVFEGIHVIGFWLMNGLLISSIYSPNLTGKAIGVGVNLAVNVYPIMLQRYNRNKIYRALEKRAKRKEDKNENIILC